MIIQISSGQGPPECELCVLNLLNYFDKKYDIQILDKHDSRFSYGLTSATISTDDDLTDYVGTVQWICGSPIRIHHKRKNWFIDVSVIDEAEQIPIDEDYKFETFHSGGKGGQNVNKVETGVRLIHIPTGISIESTSERNQYLNKRDCIKKLNEILSEKNKEALDKQKNDAWKNHNSLVRGNPVKIFKGSNFKEVK